MSCAPQFLFAWASAAVLKLLQRGLNPDGDGRQFPRSRPPASLYFDLQPAALQMQLGLEVQAAMFVIWLQEGPKPAPSRLQAAVSNETVRQAGLELEAETELPAGVMQVWPNKTCPDGQPG
jgi:hypothetical protein